MPNPRAAHSAATRGVAPERAGGATLRQILCEAQSGHLGEARQMIRQVLMQHPRSAKAHFVAAELASRAGKSVLARGELRQAEELAPGLQFATPQAVRSLKAGLDGGAAGGYEVGLDPLYRRYHGVSGKLLRALGYLIWAIVRPRRPAPATQVAAGAGAAQGGAAVLSDEEAVRHFLDHYHRADIAVFSADEASNDHRWSNDLGVDESGGWDDAAGARGAISP